MWEQKKVSLVFPAYNEEAGIRQAIEDFEATGVIDEIIVVNNNSTDRTAEEVALTTARIVDEKTQGYGAALTRGLNEASGDLVFIAEPDGTFVAKDVLKLLAYIEDFEMVCGTRTAKELIWDGANMGWFMRNGNTLAAKFLQVLHNTGSLSDCGCTFRLFRRDALDKILPGLTVTGSHFLPETVVLARKSGVSIIEIPLNYRSRRGESKITGTMKGTVVTALHMLWLIIRYRFKR